MDMKKEKVCQLCVRSFEYRKKWEKNWNEVKFCSDRCRAANKTKAKDIILEYKKNIITLLKTRAAGKSICPSEILIGIDKQNKEKMEMVRQAARLLADEKIIEITQGSTVVDPNDFRGPIRLRLLI
jgi:hypothetical protein